ncbi:protein frigida [Phtheirospermum japonicum]|uniref:FRIGIDA-like protein n=1 Tax=Phtheirospermum japonicum TaxID=374723 RepID=A0A830BHX6_9LAMI|nr:protein frigida [Phtheirospermum japonicum]
MATTDAVTPPPTADPYSPTAVSPSPEGLQDLTPISDRPSDASPFEQLETPPPVTLPPLFIQSIAELKGLYNAIQSFQQCYEDLHKHLDSIKGAISSKLPPENQHITPTDPSPSSSSPKPNESETAPRPDESEGTLLHNQQSEPSFLNSELESLCKTMCSRGIRKYLSTHLSNLPKVREEVPKALKLAPNPPKLVLECLGKFYLQGSKAFSRNSPMIPAREASILILECFLLMMGVDNGVLSIDKALKTETDKAALAWRKRMLTEGGVAKANQIDARGLLLFVACFGVPDSFKRDDIRDLVMSTTANDKEIVGVLQKSHLLMNKIPEMVEGMMKNRMEVDAVNLVYTFGLEERFNPQTILVSYLRESKESWKKTKKGQQGPAVSLNEANKKQLAALRSIRRCLERHKVDPAKLLPGWQINEKIMTLEREIGDADKKSGEKSAPKRKANETDTSRKLKPHDPKRSRYMGHGPQQPKAAVHADLNRRNLLDSGGLTNHHHHHPNNYPASTPIIYGGPGAGLLPESMIPSGVGPGISTGMLPTAQYAGVHGGGVMVDTSGQVINHGAHPYSWHRDPVMNDRYAAGQPSVGLTSLYRGSTSVEGYGAVGNVSSVGGVGSRGSDLYQFADSVVQTESYQGGGVPQSVPAGQTDVTNHYSSYLYQV